MLYPLSYGGRGWAKNKESVEPFRDVDRFRFLLVVNHRNGGLRL